MKDHKRQDMCTVLGAQQPFPQILGNMLVRAQCRVDFLSTPEYHALVSRTAYCCTELLEQNPRVRIKILKTWHVIIKTDQSEWTLEQGPGALASPTVHALVTGWGAVSESLGNRPGQQGDIQGAWGRGHLLTTMEILPYFLTIMAVFMGSGCISL